MQCCGLGISDTTLTVDGHTFRITVLKDVIEKHKRLSKKGVQPFLRLHQELGVEPVTLNKIIYELGISS